MGEWLETTSRDSNCRGDVWQSSHQIEKSPDSLGQNETGDNFSLRHTGSLGSLLISRKGFLSSNLRRETNLLKMKYLGSRLPAGGFHFEIEDNENN